MLRAAQCASSCFVTRHYYLQAAEVGAGLQRRLQPHRILQVTTLHAFAMYLLVWCGAAPAATSALFRVRANNSWGVIVTAIAVCWGRGTNSTFATRSRSSTMFAKELRASRRFLSCSLRLRGTDSVKITSNKDIGQRPPT